MPPNTPNTQGDDIVPAVERYVVLPGQAMTYQIGNTHIVALRQQAEDNLGDAFDIRGLHDAVLERADTAQPDQRTHL